MININKLNRKMKFKDNKFNFQKLKVQIKDKKLKFKELKSLL